MKPILKKDSNRKMSIESRFGAMGRFLFIGLVVFSVNMIVGIDAHADKLKHQMTATTKFVQKNKERIQNAFGVRAADAPSQKSLNTIRGVTKEVLSGITSAYGTNYFSDRNPIVRRFKPNDEGYECYQSEVNSARRDLAREAKGSLKGKQPKKVDVKSEEFSQQQEAVATHLLGKLAFFDEDSLEDAHNLYLGAITTSRNWDESQHVLKWTVALESALKKAHDKKNVPATDA